MAIIVAIFVLIILLIALLVVAVATAAGSATYGVGRAFGIPVPVAALIGFGVAFGILAYAASNGPFSDSRSSSPHGGSASASSVSRPPPPVGRYEFSMPNTHKISVEAITPDGDAARGPLRFWQCVHARVPEGGGEARLRLRGDRWITVPASAIEPLGFRDSCKGGRGYVPTEKGFKYAEPSMSYVGVQPICDRGANGRFWSCLNR